MNDTISRQAAIDAIQKDRETSWKELDGEDDEYRSGCDDGYAYSMKVISELPSAQPEHRWIPCSEENPKKTGYYICTCRDGVCNRTSVLKWSTGWVLTGARAYWKVIAWMPLPKPWKGEKHE